MEELQALASLEQPIRRDLFRLLTERDSWLTRDEAAAALDLARPVAAFHLDKLVDAGVLEVTYRRTSGRTGPGAGRPAKHYRPSRAEVAASVPERHYDLAGALLAAAVAETTRTGTPVDDCLAAAARAAGRDLGQGAGTDGEGVLELLARNGYEPEVLADGEVALRNCPFHRLAEEHRALICGMNLDFLTGVLEGAGLDLAPRLAPESGHCCVRLSAA